MTIDEAQQEAERRWGPNGQVVESWHMHKGRFTVGIRMGGESAFFPAIAGQGDSWEAAFAEATKLAYPLHFVAAEGVNRPLCRACHRYIYAAQQKCPKATGFCQPLAIQALSPRDLLVYLRIWMEGHLERLSSRSYSGERGATGNSWSVCEVPDWDMRQRLAEINAALAEATDATS